MSSGLTSIFDIRYIGFIGCMDFRFETQKRHNMISSKVIVMAFIISAVLIRASPIDKRSGKKGREGGGRDGSCTKEECEEGLAGLKLSADCLRAPFCIRKVIRSMRKLDREKVTHITVNTCGLSTITISK